MLWFFSDWRVTIQLAARLNKFCSVQEMSTLIALISTSILSNAYGQDLISVCFS
jgi:hypothetical protein